MKKILLLSAVATLALSSTLSARDVFAELDAPSKSKLELDKFQNEIVDKPRPDFEIEVGYKRVRFSEVDFNIDSDGVEATALYKVCNVGLLGANATYLGFNGHVLSGEYSKVGVIGESSINDKLFRFVAVNGWRYNSWNIDVALNIGYNELGTVYQGDRAEINSPTVGVKWSGNVQLAKSDLWIGLSTSYDYGYDPSARYTGGDAIRTVDYTERVSISVPLTLKTSENYAFFIQYQHEAIGYTNRDKSGEWYNSNAIIAGMKVAF